MRLTQIVADANSRVDLSFIEMYENPEGAIRAIDKLLKSPLADDSTKKFLVNLREEMLQRLPPKPFTVTDPKASN